MSAIIHAIHSLNYMSGFFLMLIAISIGYCQQSLREIKRDIECLHEDYDKRNMAHEIRQPVEDW